MTNDLAGAGDTPYAAITFGMQAYFAKVNAEDEGVCGRNVVLSALDDNYSAELALLQTKALVEQQQVLGMVGALSTDGHREVAKYLADPNADGDKGDAVPDLFLSTGWSGYMNAGDYPSAIGYIPAYDTDGAVLAQQVLDEMGDAKPGILYTDDAVGQDYLSGAKAVLGDELVEAKVSQTNPDALPRVEGLRDAGVEAVILATPPETSAAAIEAAEAIDYEPRWFLSYGNAPSVLASELGGGSSANQLVRGFELLDGAIATAYLLSPIEDVDDPAMIEHARILATYDGTPVSSLTVYGQSVAEVMVETLARACGDLTRRGLVRAAESLSRFRTSLMLPGIEVELGDDDHRAVAALQPVEIHEDGRVLPVGDVIVVGEGE
jgi:branched-chain amino acid transport system substrate-binding protein